jgi:hypothetical protein
LIFVRNVIVGMEMRDRIRIAASGKLNIAFSIAQNIAFGADWRSSARAFNFLLGCVMSKRCHTGTCPTGVTTHDPSRQRGLDVPDKALRVASFHKNTLHALGELVGAAGLEHPHQLRPRHIHHRICPVEVRAMSEIYPFLATGALLNDPERTPYADAWRSADPDSRAPKDHAGPGRHIAPA